MLIKLKKAQSTAEYAILFALVITAAMGIQNHVKKALQARVHDAVVDFVDNTGGRNYQWEPGYNLKTTTGSESSRTFQERPDSDRPWFYNETSSADFISTDIK